MIKLMLNPLDIFNVWTFVPILTTNTRLAYDWALLTVIGLCAYWQLLVIIYHISGRIIPLPFSQTIMNIHLTLAAMVDEQVGKFGSFFMTVFYTTCFVIYIGNSHGLLPFSYTITAHIFVTGSLSLAHNLGLFIMGVKRHGLKPFLNTFFPKGITGPLAYLVALIEIVSYLMRPLSLGVRLFANMLAGHLLLYILCTFIFKWESFLGLIPTYIVMCLIVVLELAIAVIQAYVFAILLTIYLRDPLSRL